MTLYLYRRLLCQAKSCSNGYPNLHPKTFFLQPPVGPTSHCRTHLFPRSYFPYSTFSENKALSTSPENSSSTVDLPAGLRRELMPSHVAMILDGNRRWAQQRGYESEMGHDAGLHVLLDVMGLCAKWGVKVATFFLLSTENWSRPKEQLEFVMRRFEKMLVDELENFMRQGIRITTIGNTTLLMNSLQEVLEHTKEVTKNNTRTQVIFAVSYSGQDDITQACQRIATKVRDGLVEANNITKAMIQQELETRIANIPCPDLLIRTSGELRISNFLLWQLAYSEFYFSDALWPDFGEVEFIQALLSFQKRRRRFGGR